jgi:hypothetical protein
MGSQLMRSVGQRENLAKSDQAPARRRQSLRSGSGSGSPAGRLKQVAEVPEAHQLVRAKSSGNEVRTDPTDHFSVWRAVVLSWRRRIQFLRLFCL